MMVEEKRRQGLALRVGVGPLGWGWPFLFGFVVGPSFSGLKLALRCGVGPSGRGWPPFLGLGLAVPSFGQGLASGVGPSRCQSWPFLLFDGGSPFLLGVEVGPLVWGLADRCLGQLPWEVPQILFIASVVVFLVVNRDRYPEVNCADRGDSTVAVLGGLALLRHAWLDSGYMLFVSTRRLGSFFLFSS